MKKIVLIIPLALSLLISCSITQSYHFNSDFSGNSKIEVDASSYISLMQLSDTSGTSGNYMDTISIYFVEAANFLRNSPGISDVQWESDQENSKFHLSFTFDKIDNLNNVVQNEPVGFNEIIGGKPSFIAKGKKLSYFFGTKGKPMEDAEEYESMKDMFSYKLNFSFEGKIGKASFPNLEISEDKSNASFSTTLIDITALDPKVPIIFKLK